MASIQVRRAAPRRCCVPSKAVCPTLALGACFSTAAARPKPPKSVYSIPTTYNESEPETAAASIFQVGATRRVLLHHPHWTADELEGMAYRIRALSRNGSINSILLANTSNRLPSSLGTDEKEGAFVQLLCGDIVRHVPHVSGGYNPRSVCGVSAERFDRLLTGLSDLAIALRGVDGSKVPAITMPHGLLSDGGYALAMGSYVLATNKSSFSIQNPSRGLGLDPIGFSYMLPRLGWEYDQPSADYPVGQILALTGYEADASDMMETGLATHYVGTTDILETLERSLAEFNSWDEQAILDTPVLPYTGGLPMENRKERIQQRNFINAEFKNVAVANLIHHISDYDAAEQGIIPLDDEEEESFISEVFEGDPSLVLNREKDQMYTPPESMLMTIALNFQQIFEEESSVEGILERLKEVASSQEEDDEEAADVAKDMIERMEAQSPLALKSVHRLLQMGMGEEETLESCMMREKSVQMKLFQMDDFMNWAKNEKENFKDWKHGNVAEVTNDEIEELLG